ncbi:hypothetical protein DVH24_015452 [Malus domestica]|uniref:Uncharacterized protein n=1 Tax=Malus domestica TaxID=3750 RepID=A0A498HJF5_MALDO|nr:hypothetical protein DVH24_015452 [Malus domestica]
MMDDEEGKEEEEGGESGGHVEHVVQEEEEEEGGQNRVDEGKVGKLGDQEGRRLSEVWTKKGDVKDYGNQTGAKKTEVVRHTMLIFDITKCEKLQAVCFGMLEALYMFFGLFYTCGQSYCERCHNAKTTQRATRARKVDASKESLLLLLKMVKGQGSHFVHHD